MEQAYLLNHKSNVPVHGRVDKVVKRNQVKDQGRTVDDDVEETEREVTIH